MANPNPLQFMQQVRAEVAKVVWPTRREVVLTTIMVFIMAALAAVFFSLVDFAIRSGLTAVLASLGRFLLKSGGQPSIPGTDQTEIGAQRFELRAVFVAAGASGV